LHRCDAGLQGRAGLTCPGILRSVFQETFRLSASFSLWRFYGGPEHYGLSSSRLSAGVIVIVSPIQTEGYLVAAGV